LVLFVKYSDNLSVKFFVLWQNIVDNTLTIKELYMLNRNTYLIVLLCILPFAVEAIPFNFTEKLNWGPVQRVNIDSTYGFDRLMFEGAHYQGLDPVPHFRSNYPLHNNLVDLSVRLENMVFASVSEKENQLLSSVSRQEDFEATVSLAVSRKQPYASVDVLPLRWNKDLQTWEKLISFDIIIEVEDRWDEVSQKSSVVNNSVLASGDWYKVRIDRSGIFRITYQELEAMGFDVSVDPGRIALYGNGGGILPEKNNDFRHEDLVENPILVVGESDGSFDPGDYIIFYGEGPVVWKYNYITGSFHHQTNYYDDYTYYFITAKNASGRRVREMDQPEGDADISITAFTDYAYHEIDKVNIAGTGRIWYGEIFDFNSTQEFSFSFPNIVKTEEGEFRADFASVAGTSNAFQIFINDQLEKTVSMPTIPGGSPYQKAKDKSTGFDFLPASSNVIVKLVYQRSSNSSTGYLDFFDLNVKRQLRMSGNQMMFREYLKPDDYNIATYTVNEMSGDVTIWDITNAVNPRKVKGQLSGGTFSFKSNVDSTRQYIAFNGQEYYTTEFVEKVANQNLHQVNNIDYLIISPDKFLEEANRLANFHSEHSGLKVFITTPEKIYNEFSSGSKDITAIRDFTKMLYDNSDAGQELKYLLLFGDASYDYKDIIPDNNNLIPCWESEKSLNIVHSIATDDYYGYLDDGEGDPNSNSNYVDIGIGRFVVSTLEEATMAVDKSIHYASNSDDVLGPWRNLVTFVADDADNNLHLNHGETLSDYIYENYPVYNIDKIYVDAYKQVSTPSGQRAPEVNRAINTRMEQGTLIMNYNGHGGEIGWGHERFLEIADINSWTNYDMMPIFITATCEFSRYDDPTRVSAGELVFLNEKGGAIALFSTARATFASSNLALNMAIYEDNLFTKVNGDYPCFGDVIMNSKILGGDNDKKFILMGDPALKLAYPEYWAETIRINEKLIIEDIRDTLSALSQVRIEGEIMDDDGKDMPDYAGVIYPTIYDKYSEIVTLGDESSPTTFNLRQSVLFNGKASVTNGKFTIDFIVPKDIAYKYGGGRISYYLKSETQDGHGFYENIVIGGYDDAANEDNEGPEIRLFMNDTTFLSGGKTDQNPVLLARVADESGINTTGNGIGHDIMATLDADNTQSFVLNQFYEADIDSYNGGQISYPFRNLSEGEHTLSLKVWDIYNNSSTAYLKFVVVNGANLIVENLLNYPNPFMQSTSFVFDHNQSGQDLDVKIEIFNSMGTLVKTLETRMNPEGYRSDPIVWDGTTDSGGQIGRGFYIYRVVVRAEDGSTQQDQSRLVYVRQ
jgi:hypothetical protein